MNTVIETPDTQSKMVVSLAPFLKKLADLFPFIEKIEIIEDNGLITICYFSLLENGSIILENKHGRLFFKKMFVIGNSAEFFVNWSAN